VITRSNRSRTKKTRCEAKKLQPRDYKVRRPIVRKESSFVKGKPNPRRRYGNKKTRDAIQEEDTRSIDTRDVTDTDTGSRFLIQSSQRTEELLKKSCAYKPRLATVRRQKLVCGKDLKIDQQEESPSKEVYYGTLSRTPWKRWKRSWW
jgi:hypothetical protein